VVQAAVHMASVMVSYQELVSLVVAFVLVGKGVVREVVGVMVATAAGMLAMEALAAGLAVAVRRVMRVMVAMEV